jgi:hypothetical protein
LRLLLLNKIFLFLEAANNKREREREKQNWFRFYQTNISIVFFSLGSL